MTYHLARQLKTGSDAHGARLFEKLQERAHSAKGLAYRLYTLCGRIKRPEDALYYNTLAQSWPEMQRPATEDAGHGHGAAVPGRQGAARAGARTGNHAPGPDDP